MNTVLKCAMIAILPVAMAAAGAQAQAHAIKHHHRSAHRHHHGHHGKHGHHGARNANTLRCVPTPDKECHDNGGHK
jgi:hypothetical protein